MPPDVRKRYEMLEQSEMPTVAPDTYVDNDENGDEDTDANDNNNENEDENDNDTDEDNTNVDVSGVTVQQVSMPTCPRIPRHLNIVTI
jgi:hypothetical protein